MEVDTLRVLLLKLKMGIGGADGDAVLMAFAVVVAVITVPLCGGHLMRLADMPLRHAWSLGAALAVQIVIISMFPTMPDTLAKALHLGSYAFAAIFLFANRQLVGLWVAAVGAAANFVAIAANNGVMPASADALRSAGRLAESQQFENSAVVSNARLAFLGDVFAIPATWPMANVFSIGDVLIAVGIAMTLHAACRSRLALVIGSRAEPASSVTA